MKRRLHMICALLIILAALQAMVRNHLRGPKVMSEKAMSSISGGDGWYFCMDCGANPALKCRRPDPCVNLNENDECTICIDTGVWEACDIDNWDIVPCHLWTHQCFKSKTSHCLMGPPRCATANALPENVNCKNAIGQNSTIEQCGMG